jgi:hypothetical protein
MTVDLPEFAREYSDDQSCGSDHKEPCTSHSNRWQLNRELTPPDFYGDGGSWRSR